MDTQPTGRHVTSTPGPNLDRSSGEPVHLGGYVKQIRTEKLPQRAIVEKQRGAQRRAVTLPARLTWKDQRGAVRFATVITRNVSELGVFVECQSAVSIPLY